MLDVLGSLEVLTDEFDTLEGDVEDVDVLEVLDSAGELILESDGFNGELLLEFVLSEVAVLVDELDSNGDD